MFALAGLYLGPVRDEPRPKPPVDFIERYIEWPSQMRKPYLSRVTSYEAAADYLLSQSYLEGKYTDEQSTPDHALKPHMRSNGCSVHFWLSNNEKQGFGPERLSLPHKPTTVIEHIYFTHALFGTMLDDMGVVQNETMRNWFAEARLNNARGLAKLLLALDKAAAQTDSFRGIARPDYDRRVTLDHDATLRVQNMGGGIVRIEFLLPDAVRWWGEIGISAFGREISTGI
jgi:hypothetical protein